MVVRINSRWRRVAVLLEAWVVNTTAELLGSVLGRHIAERLQVMGAAVLKLVYDAQAAAVLVVVPLQHQCHPLHTAQRQHMPHDRPPPPPPLAQVGGLGGRVHLHTRRPCTTRARVDTRFGAIFQLTLHMIGYLSGALCRFPHINTHGQASAVGARGLSLV